jgi:hypothetical protein
VSAGQIRKAPKQPRKIVVKLFLNEVFTVDDGSPRDIYDPKNTAFLNSIKKQEVPAELQGNGGADVTLSLMQVPKEYDPSDFPKCVPSSRVSVPLVLAILRRERLPQSLHAVRHLFVSICFGHQVLGQSEACSQGDTNVLRSSETEPETLLLQAKVPRVGQSVRRRRGCVHIGGARACSDWHLGWPRRQQACHVNSNSYAGRLEAHRPVQPGSAHR